MAKPTDLQRQQERLKLKAEQLNLRVKIAEHKDRLQNVTQQLKAKGGRIR